MNKKIYQKAESLVGIAKYYYVSIFPRKYDSDRELQMEKIAKSLNGYESGSGCGMGGRDISYVFLTQPDIKKFIKKIKSDIFVKKQQSHNLN